MHTYNYLVIHIYGMRGKLVMFVTLVHRTRNVTQRCLSVWAIKLPNASKSHDPCFTENWVYFLKKKTEVPHAAAAVLQVHLHKQQVHSAHPKSLHMWSRPEAFSTFCGPTQSTDGCPDIQSIHSDLDPMLSNAMLYVVSSDRSLPTQLVWGTN